MVMLSLLSVPMAGLLSSESVLSVNCDFIENPQVYNRRTWPEFFLFLCSLKRQVFQSNN